MYEQFLYTLYILFTLYSVCIYCTDFVYIVQFLYTYVLYSFCIHCTVFIYIVHFYIHCTASSRLNWDAWLRGGTAASLLSE